MDKKIYNLTFPQQNILFMERFNDNSSVNVITGLVNIKKEFNEELCKKAINEVIEKNIVMRTRILEDSGDFYQYFVDYINEEIEIVDMSSFSKEQILEYIDGIASQSLFSLDSKLYNFKILKYSDDQGSILMQIHHLISDAWSCSKIGTELIQTMERYSKNDAEVEELNSYVDFISSENEYKTSEKYVKDQDFWREYLSGINETVSLKEKTTQVSNNANRYSVKLDIDLNNKIIDFCKENRISPYALFLAAVSTYIYRVKDKNDFILGTPVLNRSNFKEKKMLGMFVSTLPLRVKIEEDEKFVDLTKKIGRDTLSVFRHQKYPYMETLRYVRENSDIKSNLYNIVLSYQNARTDVVDEEKYSTSWAFSKMLEDELQIHITDMDDTGILNINYDYKTDLFKEIEIKYLHTRIMAIIENAIENIKINVEDIRIMSKEEENKILHGFNNTKTDYPKNSSVVDLFKEQVSLNPNKVAVEFNNEQITYLELDEKSDILADFLISRNIEKGNIIGILMDKSIDMIISIIAILKCNAIYLPIEKSYPQERIDYIVKDSACKLILSDTLTTNIEKTVLVKYILQSGSSSNDLLISKERKVKYNPNSSVYIMYTSGTTGKPKGVCVTNQNIIRLVKNTNYIEFYKTDRILQTGSISFDAATFEIWGALLNGITLCLIDKQDLLNPLVLEKKLQQNNITIMWLTAPLFNQMVDYNPNMFASLRVLLIGGDVLSLKHVNNVRKNCKNIKIINGYGPTENTTFSTCFSIEKTFEESIPIGKPISNSTCYVVDKKNRLLPIMVKGELLVGGDGVSKGYLNNKKLTEEKFISDQFNQNKRAYKTGDIVYYTYDGLIKFIGRKDYQLKIRGFRVEISEIQKTILSLDYIKDAFVSAKEDNGLGHKLYAYYTLNNEDKKGDIKKDLRNILPQYMIPDFFICVNNIPLNQNGKVDKAKLMQDNPLILEEKKAINKPTTKVQEELLNIVKKVLKLEDIDVKESLFSYGMDSLLAIRIGVEISKEYNVNISAKDIFQSDTIEKIEEYIKKYSYNVKKNVEFDENKMYPLTDSQMGIFVEYSKNPDLLLYNIPFELCLEEEYNVDYVKDKIEEIIKKHKTLFTKFIIENTNILQKVELRDFSIKVNNMSIDEYMNYKNKFVSAFDLLNDFLFKVEICKVEKNIYVLFDIHHIIFDGTSIYVLINDILNALEGKNVIIEDLLPGQIAMQELEDKNSKQFLMAKEHILDKFKGELPISTIPYDRSIKEERSSLSRKGDCIESSISNNTKLFLENYSKENGITLNNILFSIFSILLSKYTYSDDVVLGIASSCRNTEQEFKSIGMFVNTLPIKLSIDYNLKIKEFMGYVQDETIDAINYDVFSYKDLISELAKRKEYSEDIIKIMFVYQNIVSLESDKMDRVKITEIDNSIAKFDLSCQVIPGKNNINIKIEYSKELYNENTIKRFLKEYIYILENLEKIVSNNSILSEIEIVDDEEKSTLVNKFNDTFTNYPKDLTIAQVFEQQVEKNATKTAVIFKDEKLSYSKLNEKSNSFARYLREEISVKPNQVIAFVADKSFETIIGILGILKAGACYLPIDIYLPPDRINYMISNSKSNIVINASDKSVDFIEDENPSVKIINMNKTNFDSYSKDNVENVNISDDRAYIMYTSGSTGKPKGCINSHKGVIKLVKNINYLDIEKVDTVFLSGNLVFDASLHEMWICLLNGKTGIIINKSEVLTPTIYAKYFEKYSNILVIFTTQLFHQYAQNIPDIFKNVKYVLCGGDILLYQYVKNVKKVCKDTDIINIYGPAECSAAVSTFTVDDSIKNNPIPIGRPISNSKCYVLDKTLNLCPINVQGELYIGGDGVGMGYINNPKITKQSFIDNFIDNSSSKIYKTGDIVKWNEKGILEFLGRKDKQVKIRGYRVEISEIEDAALEYNGIKEIKIVVRKHKLDKQLVMYFTADKKININHFRKKIAIKLPSYMVPDYLVQLDEMPLNSNGKIDEKLLPNVNEITIVKNIVKPRNDIEFKLEKIVCEVLGIKECSVKDNLFNIGLDSINVTRLCIEAMNKNLNISYSDVFDYPTIEKLAKLVNNSERKSNHYDIENYDYTKINKLLTEDIQLKQGEIKDILITGGNGFLGCHVLAEFLDNYKGIAYCVVRKKGKKSGEERLRSILKYYFKDKYDFIFESRIKVIDIEISSPKFEDEINKIVPKTRINRIINSVARVKHFGRQEEFYKLNVESTEKLINISLKNKIKMIQISTLSVSGNGIEGGFTSQKLTKAVDFTEKDLYVGQQINNIYSYSKFLAERKVLENIIENKLDANIIRVGNLMGRYSDGKFQRNKSENAFVDRIKFLLENKIIPKTILENNYIELSPIDLTAKGILDIASFDHCNYIYHLYNYNHYGIDELLVYLKNMKNIDVEVLTDEEFYNRLDTMIKNKDHINLTIISDLNSDNKIDYSSNITIKHDFSNKLLNQVGFKWNIIDYKYWNQFLKELNIRKIIRSDKSDC